MKGLKNKFNLSRLFYNDRFVMIFSIILAFGIWMSIASSSQETYAMTITDIKVNFPELGSGLQFFDTSQTAEVRVAGNALIVTSLSPSDIDISPKNTSNITEAGNYTLSLTARKSGIKTDYEFTSTVTPSTIDVYVDRMATKSFKIECDLTPSTDDEHHVETPVLSQQTLTITGAETYLNKISRVSAVYDAGDDPITETTVVSADLIYYDAEEKKVDTKYLSADFSTVDVTIPVLNVKTFDIVPNITNTPESFVLDSDIVKIDPSTVSIALPKETAKDMESISTSEIDLSTVGLKNNVFNVNIQYPSGVANDDIKTAKVTFDSSKLSTRTFTIKNFKTENVSSERTVKVQTESLNVTLVGRKADINSILPENITAVIDMSDNPDFKGNITKQVTISINSGSTFCWEYGTYNVSVNSSEKTEVSEASAQESSAQTSG